jgi:hypothetical protein
VCPPAHGAAKGATPGGRPSARARAARSPASRSPGRRRSRPSPWPRPSAKSPAGRIGRTDDRPDEAPLIPRARRPGAVLGCPAVAVPTGAPRLLADALDAAQRERRTLAESLHDHALQNLLSARHELEEASESSAHPSLDRADAAIAETVGQLRDAVFELHPYVLEEAGLEAALRSVAQYAAARGRFRLDLDLRYHDRHPTRSPAAVTAPQSAEANTPVSATRRTAVAVRPGPSVTVRTLVCVSRAAGLPRRRPTRSTAETPGKPVSVQRSDERFVKWSL